ncbi:MAG TPA: TolC family outer membrane protein [Steroidobacteraceae bacterium]|nr:TolC family outer membrane protein [Steroidobacteraceae bacterium]
MKSGKLVTGLGGIAALLVAGAAGAADLLSVYDQALQNDPQIREADATRLAQRQSRPLAIANLLPGVSGRAGRSRTWGTTTVEGIPLPGTGAGYRTTDSWSLSISQSLFSWQDWMALRSAGDQVAQAEANYMAAQQALAQRVAQQYFAVLNAFDNLEAVEAARDAIQRQLEQAEQRFEVGLIAITDVQNARAERDSANAQVISSRRQLSSAEEQLRATIGVRPASLNEPAADMPLVTPDPDSEEAWVNAAMEQNLALIASRLAADIARTAVTSSFGSFMPNVSLSLNENHSKSIESSSVSDGKSVQLGFSMNLNGAGYGNLSRTRQSQYQWIAAKERLERISRDTERQTRDAYQGVRSERERVQALRQSVESARTSLEATEAGYEVGTRTAVDVLDSRRFLIQAETNFSQAKYAYLNSLIQLRLAAGDLDRRVIEEINSWLTVPAGTAAD